MKVQSKPLVVAKNGKKNDLKPKKEAQNQIFISRKMKYIFAILILFSSFFLYMNTFSNDYVLDDAAVINNNQFVKRGLKGISDIFKYDTFKGYIGTSGDGSDMVAGGRYRPFSVATFAVENQFFPNNAFVGHFFNVFYFSILCLLLYLVLNQIFMLRFANENLKRLPFLYVVPFLAALLFAIHPIHTEVVANIKGRDEIFALLGALLSIWLVMSYLQRISVWKLIVNGFVFFMALLSKENAITFLAIIPLVVYFFTNFSRKNTIFALVPPIVATVIFLIIRYKVIGFSAFTEVNGLLNNPFLEASFSQKMATIFYTLVLYIKLLVFPHPLTYDYYPNHIQLVDWLHFPSIFSLLFYLSIFVYALLKFKKRDIFSFSILYFLITVFIVSNLIFSVGVYMAERFAFMPSVGFCIAVAYLLYNLYIYFLKKMSQTIAISVFSAFLFVVIVLLSAKTFDRNMDWKDNFTLFSTDIKTSHNSIKGCAIMGQNYVMRAQNQTDSIARMRDLDSAIVYLKQALEMHPVYLSPWIQLTTAYELKGDIKTALEVAEKSITYNQDAAAYYSLGTLYVNRQIDFAKAIKYLTIAYEKDPDYYVYLQNLAGAYYYNRDFENAIKYWLLTEKYIPEPSKSLYQNLCYAYQLNGNAAKAEEYKKKVEMTK